jgi:L-ribulokinase
VTEFVIAGGLIKNAMLMQIYSDVLGMPLTVVSSDQAPALGSAIHAAVAAGAYPNVPAAAAVMGRSEKDLFTPIPANVTAYNGLFAEYTKLHDYFGRGENPVMHRLRELRRAARAPGQVSEDRGVGANDVEAALREAEEVDA